MSFANTTYTDIVTTTLVRQSKKLADQITGNNPLLSILEKKGNIRNFPGGRSIVDELLQKENGNAQYYSGYEQLMTGSADVISAAEQSLKQVACAVVMSGIEEAQNSGDEAVINLLNGRIKAAEASMKNLINAGLYSDGTGSGGKQITGILAVAPVDPTTGTYGGINRATAGNEFWRSYALDTNAAPSSTTIQAKFNTAYGNLVRGTDHPDLIIGDGDVWAAYLASLQTLQRFSNGTLATLGFTTMNHLNAEFINGEGIGGDATDVTAYFLNTDYLHWNVVPGKYMQPLKARQPFNQDASVTLLAAYCNLSCSGARFQGQIVFS